MTEYDYLLIHEQDLSNSISGNHAPELRRMWLSLSGYSETHSESETKRYFDDFFGKFPQYNARMLYKLNNPITTQETQLKSQELDLDNLQEIKKLRWLEEVDFDEPYQRFGIEKPE